LAAKKRKKRKKSKPSTEAGNRILFLAPTFAISFSLLRAFASFALFRG
jgi:hypothetical protein